MEHIKRRKRFIKLISGLIKLIKLIIVCKKYVEILNN